MIKELTLMFSIITFYLKIYNRTPLHFSAQNGSVEAIKLLLSHGDADLTVKDSDNKTAYDYANEKGFTEAANLIKPGL